MLLESIAAEIKKSFSPRDQEQKLEFMRGKETLSAIIGHLARKEVLIVIKSVQELVTSSMN